MGNGLVILLLKNEWGHLQNHLAGCQGFTANIRFSLWPGITCSLCCRDLISVSRLRVDLVCVSVLVCVCVDLDSDNCTLLHA